MEDVIPDGRRPSRDRAPDMATIARSIRRTIPALRFAAAGMTAAALLAAAPAFAVNPGEQLLDPKLEARARGLGEELRCMVCQNQSIDDSDAPLAKDLRLLVRERVKAGDSDDEVLKFLVERYGEFVLLRPRLRPETLVLWGLAPAVLGIGLVGYFVWAFRSRKRETPADGLTAEERARLDALLAAQADKAPASPKA